MKYKFKLNELTKKQQRYVKQAIYHGTKLETIFKRVKRFKASNKGIRIIQRIRSKIGKQGINKNLTKGYTKEQAARKSGNEKQFAKAQKELKKFIKYRTQHAIWSAKTKQAQEALKQGKRDQEKKLNAIISQGNTIVADVNVKAGSSRDNYLVKHGLDKFDEIKRDDLEEYESGKVTRVMSDDEIGDKIFYDLTGGAYGNVKKAAQGDYGYHYYYDEEFGEIFYES